MYNTWFDSFERKKNEIERSKTDKELNYNKYIKYWLEK